MPLQDAERIPNVLRELVHQAAAILGARVVLEPLGPTKLDECAPARFGRGESRTLVPLGQHVDVEAHLVVEAALDCVSAYRAGDAPHQVTNPCPYRHPSPMRSTRSTARDRRAHVARSSANRLRPAAVSL